MALNFKKARESKGLTQQQVADLIGIGRESYARYENGTRSPSLQNLSDLADLFGVTTDYLLGRTEIPNMYAQGTMSIDGIEWDIYSENKDLLPDKRKQVERQIHGAMEDGQRFTLQDSSPESLEELVRRIAEQVYQERDKQNENDPK